MPPALQSSGGRAASRARVGGHRRRAAFLRGRESGRPVGSGSGGGVFSFGFAPSDPALPGADGGSMSLALRSVRAWAVSLRGSAARRVAVLEASPPGPSRPRYLLGDMSGESGVGRAAVGPGAGSASEGYSQAPSAYV